MAKEKKVEQITDMEVDFAQWFTDVCTKAELVDYSGVKGCFILRPYGYAIWENIQQALDSRFKATGHENVSMPMLIPESLLQNGQGPDLLIVAHVAVERFGILVDVGGGEKTKQLLAFLNDISLRHLLLQQPDLPAQRCLIHLRYPPDASRADQKGGRGAYVL